MPAIPPYPDLLASVLAPDADHMRQAGAALATVVQPGDTILLGGDLGAGKTTFTQGLARALGVTGPVTSPTFVLVHTYPTAAGWDLLHADVWRLEQLQEVIDLAIPELLEDGAAAVIEWGELAAPALGADFLHVGIAFEDDLAAEAAEPDDKAPRPPPMARPDGGAGAAPGPGPDGAAGARRLSFAAVGESWGARAAELALALAPLGPARGPAGTFMRGAS